MTLQSSKEQFGFKWFISWLSTGCAVQSFHTRPSPHPCALEFLLKMSSKPDPSLRVPIPCRSVTTYALKLFFRWAPKSDSFLPALETYRFESTDVALKFLDWAHLGQSLRSLTSSFWSKVLRSLHFLLFWVYCALPFISPSWTTRISREVWFSYTEK